MLTVEHYEIKIYRCLVKCLPAPIHIVVPAPIHIVVRYSIGAFLQSLRLQIL